jgi:hypothetical protein
MICPRISSLLSLFSFLITVTTADADSNQSGCLQRSLSPDFSWRVRIAYGVHIQYETPSRIMPSWACVMFALDNPARNDTLHCYSLSDFPYAWFRNGTEWSNCRSEPSIRFRLQAQWLEVPARLDIESKWECIEDPNRT